MPFPRSASWLLVASGLGIPKKFIGGWMGTFCSRWSLLALVAAVLGFIGGCSSSSSNSPNATPTVSTVIPSNVTAGSQSFTLFVTGTGFIEGHEGASFVYWNNSPRSTVFNTATAQLQATIPASDLVTPGIVEVTVANPTPGGGTSSAVTFTIEAPQNGGPTISSLSPTSANVGGQALTVTVNGTNFAANDVVTWNSQFRTTTFVNATQLTAAIEASDIATSGIVGISVVNSANAIVASPVVDFAVSAGNNPSPSISSLAPSTISVPNGVAGLQLLVGGSNFVPLSTVQWNGVARATSYISGSQLIAVILPSDLASAGSANVSVINPAPGGGTSGNSSFTITAN